MPSPFPGMDPYIEDKNIWRGFHHVLADEIVVQLNQLMSGRYYADVEVHTVLEEIGISTTHVYPDVVVIERQPQATPRGGAVTAPEAPIKRQVMIPGQSKLHWVNVFTIKDHQLVTSIEILSPINKRGSELTKYRRKRSNLLNTSVHLVEIDLLRGGTRPGVELNEPPLETDYVFLVNRAEGMFTRESEIWPVALNEPLPKLPIPLLPPDPDVILDLGVAIEKIYDRSRYGFRIDYSQPVPPPTLRPEMAAWLHEFKHLAFLRNVGGEVEG